MFKKQWRQKEKGNGETVRWHHRLNGNESEQTPEVVKDRGALCAGVHGAAELDMTQWLNNNNNKSGIKVFSQEVTTRAYKVCLIKIYYWINNVTVTWMEVQLFSIAVLQHNQHKIHFGWSDKDNFVQQKVSRNMSHDCVSPLHKALKWLCNTLWVRSKFS